MPMVVSRAKRLITDCGFARYSDTDASAVQRYLADKRKGGMSMQTSNFYLQSIMQLCRWMVRQRRTTDNPLIHLSMLNVKADRRHDRRALTLDEIGWLLTTTENGPIRRHMTGPERATLYRLVLETGLRSSEIRSLTKGSFHLGDSPSVTVNAAYSKHRRDDVLPLRVETAALLKEFMALKLPDAKVFRMPDSTRTGRLIHADLDAARTAWLDDMPQERETREKTAFLAYRDHAGLVADFHALRHTFATLLASDATIPPRTVQALLRHSTIALTMNVYSHVVPQAQADALAKLPAMGKADGRMELSPLTNVLTNERRA
jgi:integrase